MKNVHFLDYEKNFEEVVMWRRHFHKHPELSFYEHKTARFIADTLQSFGIDVQTGVGGNGVVGRIYGKYPGPTIAFRAEMDALPIDDDKDVSYKSSVAGVAHACGHDGHIANLLGVAKALVSNRASIHGNIVLIFQHAEEKPPGGALSMIADGVLDDVDVIYSAHLSSELPLGTIATRSGATMASIDHFVIDIYGRGGHGARPHQAIDTIAITGQLITHLQQIVSRRINPIEPAVLTIGKLEAGQAFNIIAQHATLEGTVRTMNRDVRLEIEQQIRGILNGLTVSDHIAYDLSYDNGYPVLINHEHETAIIQDLAKAHYPIEQIVPKALALGGDDFAYYLQKKPGTYFFIGSQNDEPRTKYPHHHPRFDFDERALLQMAEMFFAIVEKYCSQHAQVSKKEEPFL